MNLFEKALKLATEVHLGQTDKSGRPYLLHVLTVALSGQTDEEILVGLLHDTIEDSGGRVKALTLEQAGFPLDVIDAVVALTRCPWETFSEYIERCIENPLAARVKLYDLYHNLDPNRQDFKGAESLRKRHQKAFDLVYDSITWDEPEDSWDFLLG